MSAPLLVAAGGGGDALAALIVSQSLGWASPPRVVASFSWDRYVLDPAPGPRSVGDFVDLRQLTRSVWEVTAASRLRWPGRSTLQMLAELTDTRFALLDPTDGVRGLRVQIRELIDYCGAESAMLVDVGGDVIAGGHEPGLRSPLADALSLAGLAQLPVPAKVAVCGLGLDGELPSEYAHGRCRGLTGDIRAIRPVDIEPYYRALSEHPSETTALLAAAAIGIRGHAEIRDNADIVAVDQHGADVYLVDHAAAIGANTIAAHLVDTRSFDEADRICIDICGRSEIAYERRKAAEATARRRNGAGATPQGLRQYSADRASRGVTIVTFRRLAEALGLTTYDAETVRRLAGSAADPRLSLYMLAPS